MPDRDNGGGIAERRKQAISESNPSRPHPHANRVGLLSLVADILSVTAGLPEGVESGVTDKRADAQSSRELIVRAKGFLNAVFG